MKIGMKGEKLADHGFRPSVTGRRGKPCLQQEQIYSARDKERSSHEPFGNKGARQMIIASQKSRRQNPAYNLP